MLTQDNHVEIIAIISNTIKRLIAIFDKAVSDIALAYCNSAKKIVWLN